MVIAVTGIDTTKNDVTTLNKMEKNIDLFLLEFRPMPTPRKTITENTRILCITVLIGGKFFHDIRRYIWKNIPPIQILLTKTVKLKIEFDMFIYKLIFNLCGNYFARVPYSISHKFDFINPFHNLIGFGQRHDYFLIM